MGARRFFVSGGAGVIGSALVPKLLAQGAEVLVGDLKPRPPDWPPEVHYRQGDLNWAEPGELAAFEPEVFLHLAATFERTEETYDFWAENQRHNARLSHHLMSCLKDVASLRRVVFASSYLVYDSHLYVSERPAARAARLAEDAPLRPRNLTGAAKLYHEVELSFLQHFNAGRCSTASARIFRSYGRGSRDIISRWVRTLLEGGGIELYRPEGFFDYVFADDVAEGLLRLAQSNHVGPLNLSRGRARQVSEVIDVLRTHFPALSATRLEKDVPFEASEADMRRCGEVLGWAPATDIEEGIARIVEHERGRARLPPAAPCATNVLVSSLSRKTPLVAAVRRAVARVGQGGKVLGADVDRACLGRSFVDAFWQMPPLEDLTPEALLAWCREHGVRTIIPTREGELGFYAQHRSWLARAGIHVMVASPEAVRVCGDKKLFAERLRAAGHPSIPTYSSVEACPGPRLVVKERFGAGSRGAGVGLEREAAARHFVRLAEPIVQPFVEGTEFSVDVFVDSRMKARGAVARTRDVVVNGESQVTTTRREPALEALCMRVAEQLEMQWHSCFQALRDARGDWHIIECNARFGGASTASVAAGLDSFTWFLLEVAGSDPAQIRFTRSPCEKRQVRYLADRVFDGDCL